MMARAGAVPEAGPGAPDFTHCAVCGGHIEPGNGLVFSRDGVVFRFKCAGCLERFIADPDPYPTPHPDCGCGEHVSPASEWACD